MIPERQVLMTGTFDVRNYGDLLFPIVADHHLAPLGFRVHAASPSGKATGWDDTVPVRSLPAELEALADCRDYDGVLIGGGNIIHDRAVTLPDYSSGTMADWAYPSLWIQATRAARAGGVPVAWNAPGVPYDLHESPDLALVSETLRHADYLSVRDEESVEFLPGVDAMVVPDTVLSISRVWPRHQLRTYFRTMLERKGAATSARYMTVHVKRRCLTGPVEEFAKWLDAAADACGLVPILVGIGQCHGDNEVAAEVGMSMKRDHIDLSEPLGLKEIAATIAFSDLYVGASMHGYITAASYEVRAIVVNRLGLRKITGLLRHLARPEDAVDGWERALSQDVLKRPRSHGNAGSCNHALATHWSSVAATLRPQVYSPSKLPGS